MHSRVFRDIVRAAARVLAIGSAVLLACGNPSLPLAKLSTAAAADYYWDADGTSSASTGGTGTWDTTSSLWRSGSATGTLAAWPNNTGTPDIAFFGGTAGTVTIADATAITAGGLTFTANYTLDRAGTGSLTLAGATSPVVNVGTSSTATISAGIGGTVGLTKTGSGSLVLSGSNSYSGVTTLTTGALRLANSNALGASSIIVTATVSDQTRAIELEGGITIGNAMTVSSSGLGNAGMIRNISGSNTLTNFSFGVGAGTRIGVEAGSTLRITNNLTDATLNAGQAKRFVGAGTLVLDGSNSAAFASGQLVLLGVSGSNGGTVALGNDFALGASTIQFDANATLRSSSTNARSIANPITFTSSASQVTLGSADTGNLTLSGTLTLNTNGTLAVNNAQTTISGPIAGSGFGFTKSGTGTLVLSGSNTYSGATTLTTGALRLANSSALGTSSLTVTSATNDFNRTVELVGDITVSRPIAVSSVGINSLGVLRNISGSNTLSDFSFGQAPNGTRIGVEAGSALRITNNITDATTTTQFKRLMGAGTLILDGSNSAGFANGGFFYLGLSGTGGATVALGNDFALGASTIQFDASSALRSSSTNARSIANPVTLGTAASQITFGSADTGALTLSGTLTLARTGTIVVENTQTTITGPITGSGFGFTKSGAGTLVLSGSNTYSGATTVSAGTLLAGGTSAFGAQSAALVAEGGVLDLGGFSFTRTGTVSFTGGTVQTGTITNNTVAFAGQSGVVSASLTGLVGLTKTGNGSLTLSGSNSYSGATTLNAGTVVVGNVAALGSTSGTLAVNGGTLDLAGTSVTIGVLTGSSGGTITSNTAGSVVLAVNSASSGTFAGAITNGLGTAGLSKSGAGTLVLSGSNSYSGTTSLTAGVLQLANSNALGTSSLTVTSTTNDSTRTVELVGDITVTQPITVSSIGINQLGILRNISGSNTLTNFSFGVGIGTRIGVEAGSTLRITNNLTDATLNAGQLKRFLGGGTLILDGSNSAAFSSGTTVLLGVSGSNGGTVALGNDFALGASRIQFDANATLRSASAAARSIANPVTFTNSATQITFGSADTGDLTLSGAVTLATTGTVAVHNARTTLSGVIAGSDFGLIKAGAGTLALTNANTFTGPTTVSAGTLLFNGDSSTVTGGVSVLGGVLGGTGTIGGAITVGSGGTLSPGASVESLATGTVSFGAGSTFAYEVDSTAALSVGADLLRVAGDLALAGTVELTFADLASSPIAFSQGTTFSLINYTGNWNGGFFTFGGSELASNAEFTSGLNTWRISYAAPIGGSNFSSEYAPSSSFVNVVVVPEPDTLAAAVLGGGLLLRHFRKRRRVA